MNASFVRSAAAPPADSLPRAARIVDRCHTLAAITDVPGETTRTFLSPATRAVHAQLSTWMTAAGLTVWTDAAGNLRGLLPGPAEASPRLLIGSHIDTVPNAGAFDGPLGVLLGLALVEELQLGAPPPYAIEVIAFSEEEGVRFAKPFLGSLALMGELDSATLALTDRDGISLADAIREFGLDPEQIHMAAADTTAAAYLEFHIEQGPVLDSEGVALGVVDAIAGQTRVSLRFTGQSNHAGTTPMGTWRHDAVSAAAEWIVEVERYAKSTPGLVATVGRVETVPGASNVIAGELLATLDVRHPSERPLGDAVQHLLDSATRCGSARGVSVTHAVMLHQSAALMDPGLSRLLGEAVAETLGGPVRTLTSGAGHDATIVARRIPSVMLFLRSPAGLSHHPEEAVLLPDVEAALAAGLEFVRVLSTVLGAPQEDVSV